MCVDGRLLQAVPIRVVSSYVFRQEHSLTWSEWMRYVKVLWLHVTSISTFELDEVRHPSCYSGGRRNATSPLWHLHMRPRTIGCVTVKGRRGKEQPQNVLLVVRQRLCIPVRPVRFSISLICAITNWSLAAGTNHVRTAIILVSRSHNPST